MTVAESTMKRKVTAAELAELCRQGYTIRLGTRNIGRVYPAWQWQLFTPDGEFVRGVHSSLIPGIRAAGQGESIHGNFSELKGVNR